MRSGPGHRILLSAVTLLSAGLALPAGAIAASTASYDPEHSLVGQSSLTVRGDNGQDRIGLGYLGEVPGQFVVTDAKGIVAGDGCTQQSPTEVRCLHDSTKTEFETPDIRISTRAGRDRIAVGVIPQLFFAGESSPAYATLEIFGGARRDVVFSSPSEPLDANLIDGGGGNDRLVGTRQHEILRGARGRDVLLGKAGDDVLKGGPGPDRLFGGRGSDILRGGPGRDLCRGGRGGEFLGPDLIRGC